MRLHSPSLACSLDRLRILEILGIASGRSPVLPLFAHCPLCRKEQLWVLRDEHTRADWASCLACDFSGDLIELTARTWSVGISQACERLAEEGAIAREKLDNVETYVIQHIERRRAVQVLWKSANEAFRKGEHRDVKGPLKCLGANRWEHYRLSAVNRWLGVIPKQSLEDLFHPQSYATVSKTSALGERVSRRQSGPGNSRLFKGLGWDKILLLAACDLPGRICGFLMIGREGDPAKGDVVFRTVPSLPARPGAAESGLLLSDCFFQVPDKLSAKRWPGIRFIGLDYLSTLRLQLHYVSLGERPFPLAAAFQDDRHRPIHCWNTASPKSLLFFSEKDPAGAVTAAVATGGQVGRAGSRSDVFRDQTYLFEVYRGRKSGMEAVVEELATLPVQQAAQRFRALPLSVSQRRKLLSEMTPELADIVTEKGVRQSVQVLDHVIEQNADGLFDRTTGKHLLNAIVQVHEICGAESTGRVLFGTVQIQDEETVFALPHAVVAETSFLAALQGFLQRKGRNPLVYHKRALQLIWNAILTLHKPVVSRGRVSVGWCSETQRFRFPRFQVLSGEICDGSPLEGLERAVPFADWRADRVPAELAASLQSLPADEASVFWTLFAVGIQQLIAPQAGWSRRGLLVRGLVAQELVRTMAPAFGLLCPSYPDYQSSDDQVDWLERQSREHDVPCLLDLRGGRGRTGVSRWLDAPGEKPGLLLLPEEIERVEALRKRFDSLQVPQRIRPVSTWAPLELPRELMAHYLADLMGRNFVLSSRQRAPMLRVLGDVRRWAVGLGLPCEEGLKAANRRLAPADDLALAPEACAAVEGSTADDLKKASEEVSPARGQEVRRELDSSQEGAPAQNRLAKIGSSERG